MKRQFLLLAGLLLAVALPAQDIPQDIVKEQFKPVGDSITSYIRTATTVRGSRIAVVKAAVEKKTLRLDLNPEISDYPVHDAELEAIYSIANSLLPEQYAGYRGNVKLFSENEPVENLKSNFYAAKRSQTPVKEHAKYAVKFRKGLVPLVKNESKPYQISEGLQERHIALWQSHGRFYEPSLKRWEWQRARCLQTVEDLYTQSYVLPFLVPMLENAGAVVMLPRERDWNTNEQIVDNDNPFNTYRETGSWSDAPEAGFADTKAFYVHGENPFRMGTARMSQAASSKVAKSSVCWIPELAEAGEYAVYVSYQTVANSTTSAHYTVRHNGGETEFSVNQKMGGSTWIYLGKFFFNAGKDASQGVFLTNETSDSKSVVTADAVKFGGGMGNIARKPADVDDDGNPVDFQAQPEVSGYPRFTEGSRYWLQWAGFNDTIYSYSLGVNDYNDDYMSRPRWVNALAGGSYVDPKKPGYNIPLDLSFAFHTDAGTYLDDGIVGSLSIYTRYSNGKDTYINKESRLNGREYADIVQTEIVNDIRANFEPNWNRRLLWNRSYAESRIPEVPGMLLELLSHQNLADMRYGLDPSFRFTVSRAIYKGMLKYLAYLNDFEYCVQPLPVNSFETKLRGDEIQLSWAPTEDPAEATAVPSSYVLYTRIDNGAFDNGVSIDGTSFRQTLEPGHIYSFKVTAVNAGGESFPSEILSAGIAGKGAPVALVINNFDRVSAPVSFASPDSTYAGFNDKMDSGVPYLQDINYIGSQYEFRRHIPWMDDDSAGFGSSNSDYEDKVVAGNSFDYPFIHGTALMNNGYSFVSASRCALNAGKVEMRRYALVDVICGKQLTTQVGRKGSCALKYQVFTPQLQKQLEEFASVGGNIFISGANIATDVWEPVFDYEITDSMKEQTAATKKFIQDVLHYKWMTNQASFGGKFKVAANPFGFSSQFDGYTWMTKPNGIIYAVESPDGIVPAGDNAYTIYRYDNSISAGVAYEGSYKVVSLGVPFEVLGTLQRNEMMRQILRFFSK
ncbi:MAG: xanthan lyase [Bacteroidales bacterium]|nr:xanthan lyase [Candidatus Cacconaster merdequi]